MNAKKLFLVLAGLASATGMAQTQLDTAQPMAEGTWVPVLAKTENGITYACGGVGENEAAMMRQVATEADFDMMVTFAASTGAYLADVNVEIADARGNSLLSTTCDGPMMLVDFDKGGKYRFRADVGGHTISRTAQVSNGGKLKNMTMHWPVKVVDMGLTPQQGEGDATGRNLSGSSTGRGMTEDSSGKGASGTSARGSISERAGERSISGSAASGASGETGTTGNANGIDRSGSR